MSKRVSLEVVINVVIEHDDKNQPDVNILDWQFGVRPPEDFRALSPAIRAAFWSALRDEIEECWFGAALGSDPTATWNWLLEDMDLG